MRVAAYFFSVSKRYISKRRPRPTEAGGAGLIESG